MEERQLQEAINQRSRGGIGGRTVLLGKTLDKLKGRLSTQYSRYGGVVEAWDAMLPAELSRQCRPVGVSGGQLEVAVESPVYAGQLRLCSEQLLSHLQSQCPRARIRKIKIIIGRQR